MIAVQSTDLRYDGQCNATTLTGLRCRNAALATCLCRIHGGVSADELRIVRRRAMIRITLDVLRRVIGIEFDEKHWAEILAESPG